ncbi:DUF2383 domain-containing protein [Methylotuvimicrobium alcaliphilum]|uniref:DUF2383 domain-containing protein n=1 Tax=Methylotuvimicrobium alcaliphilum (strain DSM 19304 / NCIMB 14124 / VKM B-2133 / 20Z) TaxID=1091494 RepID=G4SX72_META2|nr:DUF2383 domain-containing protein [Methylotuvimicrobium alcaliphilum]CCE24228.1 conserved protein of unknown function [Methylotuvimicrobium alcaliphilum 20Z]
MHNIETLNKFLKDELSATETYQQALDKLHEDVVLSESEHLRTIYEDHKASASSLQSLIIRLGGTPCEDSGAWGTWAQIVQGGANLLGKETALKSLQSGEKSGAEAYEEALQETELPSEIRSLIETKLLPAQQEHIRTLDRLIGAEAD